MYWSAVTGMKKTNYSDNCIQLFTSIYHFLVPSTTNYHHRASNWSSLALAGSRSHTQQIMGIFWWHILLKVLEDVMYFGVCPTCPADWWESEAGGGTKSVSSRTRASRNSLLFALLFWSEPVAGGWWRHLPPQYPLSDKKVSGTTFRFCRVQNSIRWGYRTHPLLPCSCMESKHKSPFINYEHLCNFSPTPLNNYTHLL